jgi:hypothetical protein
MSFSSAFQGVSFRWQAARRAGAISRKAGASVRQRAIAKGQRGWKWQPDGGSSGEGMSPFTAS